MPYQIKVLPYTTNLTGDIFQLRKANKIKIVAVPKSATNTIEGLPGKTIPSNQFFTTTIPSLYLLEDSYVNRKRIGMSCKLGKIYLSFFAFREGDFMNGQTTAGTTTDSGATTTTDPGYADTSAGSGDGITDPQTGESLIMTTIETSKGTIIVQHEITFGDLLISTILMAMLIFMVLERMVRR